MEISALFNNYQEIKELTTKSKLTNSHTLSVMVCVYLITESKKRNDKNSTENKVNEEVEQEQKLVQKPCTDAYSSNSIVHRE